MLPPLPRRSGWAYYFARSPRRISLPRKGCVLFEACSAFTRVTACTLALSPIRDTHSEGFSYFVTSIAAPVASGWSGRRVGFAPTGKSAAFSRRTPRTDSGPTRAERLSRVPPAEQMKFRCAARFEKRRMSAPGVRRDKAALSSGCKSHPATAPAGSDRSSHRGNEMVEAFG